MRAAFVTGGSGFLGTSLVEALCAAGYRVVAVHRASSDIRRLRALGVELHEAGVEDKPALSRAMPEAVDVVFHLAGDISWWKGHAQRQRTTNVEGTRNVVEVAIARGAGRFIHTSSIAAFGLEHAVIDERTPSTAARSGIGYVATKWLGEQEVRRGIERGLDAVILNPAHVIGPHDRRGWGRLFKQLRAGKLPGVPGGRGSFCEVRAVALAQLAAVEQGRRGEQYILAGTDASYLELASAMASCLGRPAPRLVPALAVRALATSQELVSTFTRREPELTSASAFLVGASFRADSRKAVRELGHRVVPLEEMVRDCHDWLVTEP